MTYHVTTDADNDPTIWDTSESELFPRAILRRSDLPETARELWPVICEAVTDPRPCRGRNSNICVAEGCYAEACLRLAERSRA